jgi:hypothetical protein
MTAIIEVFARQQLIDIKIARRAEEIAHVSDILVDAAIRPLLRAQPDV